MGHYKYIPALIILGIFYTIMFTAVDKFIIAKISDKKKRRYVKIATYAVLYFIGACIVGEIMEWARN